MFGAQARDSPRPQQFGSSAVNSALRPARGAEEGLCTESLATRLITFFDQKAMIWIAATLIVMVSARSAARNRLTFNYWSVLEMSSGNVSYRSCPQV